MDDGNHLVVSESTSNKLYFFDLRMNHDQINSKVKQMSSKKPPQINMVCQIDSSEQLSLPDKNHKISGTASIRLHKESGSLAVVRADN